MCVCVYNGKVLSTPFMRFVGVRIPMIMLVRVVVVVLFWLRAASDAHVPWDKLFEEIDARQLLRHSSHFDSPHAAYF